MKYLKRYNESLIWKPEETEEVFTPLINWDLIADAKDMALDNIDMGDVVSIDADCSIGTNYLYIYNEKYSHDPKYMFKKWNWCEYIASNIKNIRYILRIFKVIDGRTSLVADDTFYLIERLKQAYPNENIR